MPFFKHHWSQSVSLSLLALGLVATSVNHLMPSPAVAQEITQRTLTVTGQGSQGIPTSLAEVSLGVQGEGRSAEAVQQEVSRRASTVVNLLEANAVEQLQTTGLRLSPRYRYDQEEAQITGYVGSNSVRFRVPIERSGDLLDAAIAAGANQIQGIQFVATDAAIAAAQKQAIAAAIADAQGQARVALAALDLRQRDIISIQINGANPPGPPVFRGAGPAASEASTPVVGGEQTVEASVTLQIRY